MCDDYYPGDIGLDPLGLRPEDPDELNLMITKELQNKRLAMLAAAGFSAQEAVDGKGILEHFSSQKELLHLTIQRITPEHSKHLYKITKL